MPNHEETFYTEEEVQEAKTGFVPVRKVADSICKVSEINEDERTVTAVISTATVDRDREVLVPSGADLDNYLKNPVVPWSHNSSDPPIGKAIWVKRSHLRLTAKVKFALTERAEEVWQLFKGGFLQAFSVGFMPKEQPSPPTTEEIIKNPAWAGARNMYRKWELLEFSPVTVPANPEALMLAYKNGSLKVCKGTMDMLEVKTTEPEEEELLIPVSTVISEEKDGLTWVANPFIPATAIKICIDNKT